MNLIPKPHNSRASLRVGCRFETCAAKLWNILSLHFWRTFGVTLRVSLLDLQSFLEQERMVYNLEKWLSIHPTPEACRTWMGQPALQWRPTRKFGLDVQVLAHSSLKGGMEGFVRKAGANSGHPVSTQDGCLWGST